MVLRLQQSLETFIRQVNLTDFYYTYIIECKDGSYYTGYSNDPWKRFETHKAGKGAKYTKSHPPKKLVYIECHKTKGAAMRKELMIKRLSRLQKTELINGQLQEGDRLL